MNMSLFSMFNQAQLVRDISRDPKGSVKTMLFDYLKGYLVLVSLWIITPIVIVGILAFTDIFGGPYTFFAWLWYLLVIGLVLAILVLWRLYVGIKKSLASRNSQSTVTNDRARIIEVEAVED